MKLCTRCLRLRDGSFCNTCGGPICEPTTVPALAGMVVAARERVREELERTGGHHGHQKEEPCSACAWIKAAAFDDIERVVDRVGVEQIIRANADT
ncbi:MAG: hypothetical protein Q8R16_00655 [bacterium]|nr:hypothetical protein [bacterium]